MRFVQTATLVIISICLLAPPVLSASVADADAQIPACLKKLSVQRTYKLSAEDLRYGDEQVARMVADRPGMEKYVQKGDPIWNWCARQFAGECTGSRYMWRGDASDRDGLDGWHTIAGPGLPGTITAGQVYNMPKDPEFLWGIAIFEMFNSRNDPVYLAWGKDARFGKMSQQERVKKEASLEFDTQREVLHFYRKYWVPHCEKLNVATQPHYWFADAPDSFDEWFNSIPKDSPYMRHYSKL